MSALSPAVVRYVREVRVVHSGRASYRFPVIVPLKGTNPVPFAPLLQFFVETHGAGGLASQDAYARSLHLLLEHFEAHGERVEDASPEALQRFVDDLLCGTVDEHRDDPLGLYWRPANNRVVDGHLRRVSVFSDWAVQRLGHRPLNPLRPATSSERSRTARWLERRSQQSMLSHAAVRRDALTRASQARTVRVDVRPRSDGVQVRAITDANFQRIMDVGWGTCPAKTRAAEATRLRNRLMCLLMRYGGLRLSELFHLFVGDVQLDPNEPGHALVWLFHPERGDAPNDRGGPWRDRAHYLSQRFNRRPRSLERGRFRVGWKNLALIDSTRAATRAWFCPTDQGKEFWNLYMQYLAVRAPGDHPYLFVSEHGDEKGDPYTPSAFKKTYRLAVERAGLVHGKREGTSPHSLRHAYGLSLAEAGIDPRLIREALHHRSLESQTCYTAPRQDDVHRALRRASALLRTDASTPREVNP